LLRRRRYVSSGASRQAAGERALAPLSPPLHHPFSLFASALDGEQSKVSGRLAPSSSNA